MSLISVIDLGTGSIRNTLYDQSGGIVDVEKRDNPILHPHPGWAEQDPVYWWQALKETFASFRPAIRKSISAISATSQREGIVPVNEHFEPLGNIIIWLDGRTGTESNIITERLGEQAIYDITGLVANPAWSLSKILWIKKHQPEIYKKASKFLQAEDFVLSRLSGRAVSELSIASRTCMLDVVNRKWSDFIIDLFDIDKKKLPELLEPGDLVGKIHPPVAEELGLPKTVKIYMGAGDQQAAAIGVGALEEGMVSIGIGTSSALSMTLDKPVKARQHKIILNCAALPGKWEYEPPIWNTGGLIRWFFDNVCCTDHGYDDIMTRVKEIPAGSEGLLALPYFSGAGSPRWNPALKGAFYGLGLHHNRLHLLRAIMESVAYEIKFNIESIQTSGIQMKNVILSGGASVNRPLCQIICDVLQTRVNIFTEAEASSRGIFILLNNVLNKNPWGNYPQNNSIAIEPNNEISAVYQEGYARYIELGNTLQQLSF